MVNLHKIIVAADGVGQFSKIQYAVDSIPEGNGQEAVIYIKRGVYREKVFIDKPLVTLVGEHAEDTVIEYGDYAKMKSPEGENIGTFCTYTIFVGSKEFKAENLTFVNSAGKGEVVGQAVAAYVDGDRAQFMNCRFIGNQDTLFTGPLPPAPLTVRKFGGPRDGMPRTMTRQYYKNCYIQGDIDFIFGSATAVFEECEIFSNRLKPGEYSYITAPSTPEGEKYGYVFIRCRLTGNAASHSVYLGRPWRNFGKAAFISCTMGEHITEEGWHNWDKPESESTTDFAEYNSTGPGSDRGFVGEAVQSGKDNRQEAAGSEENQLKGDRLIENSQRENKQQIGTARRVPWARQLNREEAEQYKAEIVLSGDDGWRPSYCYFL